MTTDFLSLITTPNSKKAVSDKLSLKYDFNSASKNSGMFDSLLSNASKAYADKSYANSNYFNNGNYAHKTKDIQSSYSNKTDYQSKKETNNYSQKRTESKADYDKKSELKDKIYSENDSEIKNQSEKNVDKSSDKVETKDINEAETKDSKIENTNKNEESNKTDDNASKDNQNENNSENPKEHQEKADETEQNTKVKDLSMQEDLAVKNIIANEQITANVENIVQNSTVENETTQNNIETINIAAKNNNSTETEVISADSLKKIQEPNQQNTETEILDTTIKNIKNSEEISTVITQAISQEKTKNITELNTQTNQGKEQLEQNIQIQNKSIDNKQTDIISNTDVQVDINVDSQKLDTKNIKSETNSTTIKTVKESLASDNTRYTINLDNSEQTQTDNSSKTQIITPTTKPETTTKDQIPVVKVTDEVAAQASSTENLPLNKDFSANAKDKATAQMTQLEDTNTVITEVKGKTNNQSQTNSGQNNNAMTQGNASEQIIKFSVDETNTNISTNPTENFFSKLDAKLSTLSKTTNQSSMLNKSDILSQLNAKFNDMQQAGQNKISMILQPENLGRVSVEIVNSKDGIVAKMTTENQQVKELLDKNMDALRSNLSSQGVNVNNIKVECTNETSQNTMNFEREQFNQSNFSNNNGNNHQTQHSDANNKYTSDYIANGETNEEQENNTIEQTVSPTIKHDGKVDYKV